MANVVDIHRRSELPPQELKQYVALISVPISADCDRIALERAFDFANTLTHKDSECVAGHVETVAVAGRLDVRRIVHDVLDGLPNVTFVSPT